MPTGDSAFTPAQRDRLDRALLTAETETGLSFGLAIGNSPDSGEDLTLEARRLVAGFEPPTGGVILLVDPAQRRVEIATVGAAHRRIPDRQCALAALSISSRIGVGDVLGALVDGIRMLSETAGRGDGSAPAIEVGHSAVPAHVQVQAALPHGHPHPA